MNDMKEIIDEIKARCDIASIISDYIKINPSGGNYKGLCPFHVEKTPSFYINTSKQIYKCFGCGEGGDVINFIMKIENLDFMDAVKLLASRCGIDINFNMDEDTKKKIELSKKYQDIHVEAARFYYAQLMKSKNRGYDYLRNRGLDDKTIKRFGLGFAPDGWSSLIDYLTENKGYSIEELMECGLAGKSTKYEDRYYDKFRNRVMFPIFDYRGNVIGFGGRVLDDSLPKYLNSPDTLIFNKRHNLYGLNFARKNIKDRTLILVEGYMDLISLNQYGIKNTVATLGTAITQQQASLIKRYADVVIISYDSDDAGIKAAIRAIDILQKEGLSARVLNLSDAKDPDEYVRKYGVANYNKAVKESIERTKFRIDIMKRDFDIDNGEDAIKFARKAANLIKSIKSPVEIDYYAGYVGKIAGIDVESIKKEIYGKSYTANRKSGKNNTSLKNEKIHIEKMSAIEHGEENTEALLLKSMLEKRDIREIASLKLDYDDFISEDAQKVFKEILEYDSKEESEKIDIKEINIPENYMNLLQKTEISAIDIFNRKEVEEMIRNVKKNGMKNKMESLVVKQAELETKRKSLGSEQKTELKEVDVEIMNIALQIVEMNKRLRSL